MTMRTASILNICVCWCVFLGSFQFIHPVTIGSLLTFTSHVVYSSGSAFQVALSRAGT